MNISPSSLAQQKNIDNKQTEGYLSIQTIDFSSFRIKNSNINFETGPDEIVIKGSNSCFLSILTGLGLIYSHQEISNRQSIFGCLNIINIPKPYINYANKKTLEELFKIVRLNTNTLKELADIITYYPIASFVLQIYSRQSAFSYLQKNKLSLEDDLVGNQQDILSDFSTELRGKTLDILVTSLKLNIQVKYSKKECQKFVRRSNIQQSDQAYGNDDYMALILVKHAIKDTIFNVIEIVRETNHNRRSRVQLIQRKNKTKDLQISRNDQSHSIPKMRCCMICGRQICSCLNIKRVISPQYMNNIHKSFINQSFNGIKPIVRPQQLNHFGFINLNKINKN